MDTRVTIEVLGPVPELELRDEIESAYGWFGEVERRCSRFDPESELMQLCRTVGVDVQVSQLLFSALEFAAGLAAATDGAFDPTVGGLMEARGFDRNYRTGNRIAHGVDAGDGSFADLELDRSRLTVRLRRRLVLDLGAVAKGLAIDLASQALRACPGFVIDAGGDIYAGGRPATGEMWRIGIHHPRSPGSVIDTVVVSGGAVCTSGDYERRGSGDEHHLVDGRTRSAARRVASATAIGPTAMLADALTTAAFALGPEAGIALFEREGVDGMIVTPELERLETRGFASYRA